MATPSRPGEVTPDPGLQAVLWICQRRERLCDQKSEARAENTFGGGSGASAKMEPVAFLIIKGDSVKLLPVDPPPATTVDRVIEVVPEVVERSPIFWKSRKKQTSPRRERTTLWCDRTDLTEFAGSGRERKPAARKILRSLCLMEGDHIETTAGGGAGRWIYALPGAHCPGGGHLRVLCHPDGGRERPGAL